MCFRPPEVNTTKNCPDCGAENEMLATTCIECGASLPAGPPMPGGAPGAPGIPGAPGAPKAPGVPGAPSVPGK